MAATSRRIACPTVTIDSRATVSGSASRIATSAIDCVISRNSCDRQAMWASTKKKMMGAKKIANSMPSTGAVNPLGPRADCSWGRYIQPIARPPSIQTTANTVAMM